jgi:predicted Mrr-cat superfamily restriction endonuclease
MPLTCRHRSARGGGKQEFQGERIPWPFGSFAPAPHHLPGTAQQRGGAHPGDAQQRLEARVHGGCHRRELRGGGRGVDIVAGAGPLGFGQPRLCVQVKSGDTPVEAKAINELRGAMQSVRASEGLFVSWGGFKGTVARETATNFFTVRLWTQKELLEALFSHYDQLSEDLKAELPLKRIWTVATQDEE